MWPLAVRGELILPRPILPNPLGSIQKVLLDREKTRDFSDGSFRTRLETFEDTKSAIYLFANGNM